MLSKALIRKIRLLRYLASICFLKNAGFVLMHFFQRHIIKKKNPSVAYLDLTFKCQFNCTFCGIASYPITSSELSTEEFKAVISQLALIKVPRIHFSGGEPLLRDDIDDLVLFAHSHGIVTILETNGYALSRDKLLSLKKHYLNSVCISLNASNEVSCDEYCGRKGSYSKVLQAIKICEEERMPCVASIVVRRSLIKSGEFQEILKLAEKLRVQAIRLITPRPMGNLWDKEEEVLSMQEKLEAKKLLGSIDLPVLGNGLDERVCGVAGLYSIFVSPYGEIQPCGYIPYSFGNVRSESINAIINRLLRHKMRSFIKSECGCAIQNPNFRKNYISCINPNQKVPVKLY